MCQGAILWAGIQAGDLRHVDPDASSAWAWRQIDIAAEEVVRRSDVSRCRITGGLLEAECDALFESAGRR